MSETFVSDGRLLVVANPNSTNFHKVEQAVIEPLTSYYGAHGYEPVRTQPIGVANNAERLAGQLRDGDVVLGCGGDGLAHIIANAIVIAGTDARYLPAPFGFGNDIPLSFHGDEFFTKGVLQPERLARTRTYAADGLMIERDDMAKPRYVLGYVGIGATADAAFALDAASHRKHKRDSRLPDLYLSGKLAWQTVWERRRQPFAYQSLTGEDDAVVSVGDLKIAKEIIYNCIPRMAKVLKFHVDAFGDEILRNEFPLERFMPRLLGRLALEQPLGGLRGRPFGDVERFRVSEIKTVTPEIASEEAQPYDLRMQMDAETEHLPYGTLVTVRRQPGMVKLLVPAWR